MFPIINLGPLSVPAAPLILLLGFWLGSALAEKIAADRQRSPETIEKILWTALLAGIIGARLSFIARNPGAFQGQLLSVFSLNPELLDITGGILIALGASYYQITKQQLNVLEVLDDFVPFFAVIIPAIFLSQFAAGAGFGIFTDLPWGIDLWGGVRHPVQIYKAISGLIVLALTCFVLPTRISRRSGWVFLTFVMLTAGYLTFLTGFQEPEDFLIAGFRATQVFYWIVFSGSLLLYHKFFLEDSNAHSGK